MNILTIFKALLSLTTIIAQYVHDKQLMQAGSSEAILKGLQEIDNEINIARAARDSANSVPVSKDPDDRSPKL